MRVDEPRSTTETGHRTAAVWLMLVLAGGIYFTLGFRHLDLPGLQYDEAYDALIALDTLHRAPLDPRYSIALFGRSWPLMVLPHEGPTTVYLSMAPIALFGASVTTLRIMHLVIGAITLLLLWALAGRWAGEWTAAITVLLTASFPPFVWWSRSGGNWNDILLPIALGMMLALDRWWRTRQTSALLLGAFLAGLGITTKILFVWLVVPLVVTTLVLAFGGGAWRARRLTLGAAIAAPMAFVCGLAPSIVYNLGEGGTLRFVFDNAVRTRVYGYNNLDVFRNLRDQVSGFLRLMGGSTVVFSAPSGWPLGAGAIVVAVAWTSIILARSYRHRRIGPLQGDHNLRIGYRQLFLLLTVVLVVPLSTVSPTHISPIYLFIIVPFAWFLVAWAMTDGVESLMPSTSRSIRNRVVLLLVAVLVANHLVTNIRVSNHFVRTGGRGLWSDSIYRLASDLEGRYAGRPVAAMDWGFTRNIAFLTDGRVRPAQLFDFSAVPSSAVSQRCSEWMRNPSSLYVFHVKAHTSFKGVWEIFEQTAGLAHRTITLEEILRERDGTPNTFVYSVGTQ